MFGMRDPVQYGTITLAEIDARLQVLGLELGARVESFRRTRDRLVDSECRAISSLCARPSQMSMGSKWSRRFGSYTGRQ